MFINDFKTDQEINMFLLLDNVVRGIATSGKPYLTLYLKDKSGSIDGKIWEVKEEDSENLKAGKMVFIEGTVLDYRGKLQLKIKNYRMASDEDNINIQDYIQTAPVPKDVMINELNYFLKEISNENLRTVTIELLNKYKKQFISYPAAKSMHHDFYSGLIYHTTTMLKIAKALVGIYPSLNKDLLYSGIILHDLGKTIELSGPVGTSYTLEGELLGHIVIMSDEVARMADKLGIEAEEITLLRHIILAHHGKYEFGSPKLPMIKEAEIIHFIDNIDARMMMFEKNLANVEPGAFSEKLFGLEGRHFYVPVFDKGNN